MAVDIGTYDPVGVLNGGQYGLPDINLLSAVHDGPMTLVLTFDRPPSGAVESLASYALTSGTGYVPAIVAVAFDTVPVGETFPHGVRLTLAEQTTDGKLYEVAVTGILGPCDEGLGVDSAAFVAVAVAPQVLSAASVGYLGVSVLFDVPVEGCGTAGDWDIHPEGGGPSWTIASVALLGAVVRLALTDPTVPEQVYTVTAPAATTDGSLNLVDPAHKAATFAAPALSGALTIRAAGGAVKVRLIEAMETHPACVEV